MTELGSIWIESMMLPFLFTFIMFLSSRFAVRSAMNRRFLWLIISTFVASFVKVIEFSLPDLIPMSVFCALMIINAYCLMRYMSVYVGITNEIFSRLHTALFFISLMSAFLVHIGFEHAIIFCYVFTIAFVIEGFVLQLLYQEFYGNGQFITMNLLFTLLLDAFILQYIFQIPVPTYAVATVILIFTFFYLEAPTYRRLITAQAETIAARIATESSIKQANSAAKAKGNFLASTSHEIRTPMNAILGMNEMILREAENDPETAKAANNIKNAGNLLLSIINNILDISKIESGKMDLYNSDYHLYPLLTSVEENVSSMVKAKNLSYELEIEDEDMPEYLNGDELRLSQLLSNLVDNAVKYTREGYVKVRVSYEQIDHSKLNLIISVQDSGIGIKPEDMDRLFTPFERVHFKEAQNISGAGLGLTLVKYIIDLMGGKIEINSTYGVGSIFTVTIPQNFGDRNISVREYKETVPEEPDDSPTVFPDAKILVVDDTQVNLAVARGMLKDSQAQVETAMSGEEALNLIEDKKYDIVFLDHRMPGMDGIETLNYAKTHVKKSRLPVFIALTADAGSGARERYIALGFDDYLAKPFKPGEMINILRKFLRTKS